MKPINDFNTKFYENDSHVGHTKLLRAKFVVLPHVAVARSCPILKHGAAEPPKERRPTPGHTPTPCPWRGTCIFGPSAQLPSAGL